MAKSMSASAHEVEEKFKIAMEIVQCPLRVAARTYEQIPQMAAVHWRSNLEIFFERPCLQCISMNFREDNHRMLGCNQHRHILSGSLLMQQRSDRQRIEAAYLSYKPLRAIEMAEFSERNQPQIYAENIRKQLLTGMTALARERASDALENIRFRQLRSRLLENAKVMALLVHMTSNLCQPLGVQHRMRGNLGESVAETWPSRILISYVGVSHQKYFNQNVYRMEMDLERIKLWRTIDDDFKGGAGDYWVERTGQRDVRFIDTIARERRHFFKLREEEEQAAAATTVETVNY